MINKQLSIGVILVLLPLLSWPEILESGSVDMSTTIESIDAKALQIDQMDKNNREGLKVFVITEKKDVLQLIEEGTETLPEQTEATYYELRGANGRVRRHTEVPTSLSGDWYAHYRHYFYENGNTMLYEFHSSSFNSGCAGILRITKRYYYDHDFNLVIKTESYTDGDKNGAPVNIERCDFYGVQREEPNISKNYVDLKGRINKDLTMYLDLRIKNQQMMIGAEENRRKLLERDFVYMVGGYKRVIPFVGLVILLLLIVFRRKIWK
jgi:hypothetical protein